VCTQEFLVQILRGQKKVFKQSEIKPITVPVTAYMTKERLAVLIAANPALTPYFPDEIAQHSDRQFLVDVVHTIDSNFFVLAFDEIQAHIDAKRVKKEEYIDVDQSMLDVIESFSNLKAARVHREVKVTLKLTKQKRKRPKREEVPLLKVKIKAKSTLG
jgi:hypothetical protein